MTPSATPPPGTPPRIGLTPTEAADAILREIHPLPTETVPITEAIGLVLARAITSPIDLPHWDNSAMDGYAVRASDVRTDGVVLRIVDHIPAGTFGRRAIGSGECARIFTGAPIPNGADCVIRQEDTTAIETAKVRVDDVRDVGRNVRRRGEDIRRDSVALERGTVVGPAQIGVLASVATPSVEVHRRPTIAILSSGDELADLNERDAILSGQKIASSNNYTMAAMARMAGAVVLDLGIVKDDLDETRKRLADAHGSALLVTSGGMSVGEHDHLRRILEGSGAGWRFWRLRMRPGAPVGFGMIGDTPWIGLPGNPVSTMVTFELFVRPAIRKLMGHLQLFRRTTPVRVGETIVTQAQLQHFLRVTLSVDDGDLTARLTGAQGSGILTSMARAHALLIVPEDRQRTEQGETLLAVLLDETIHVPHAPY
jgi:molybdopterin molybdotransferase